MLYYISLVNEKDKTKIVMSFGELLFIFVTSIVSKAMFPYVIEILSIKKEFLRPFPVRTFNLRRINNAIIY